MELVINFSGGKDSSAMLAYLCENYPALKKHVVFADTGWEHTDAESWCRKIVGMFGLELNVVRNPKDFFQMIRNRRMFPGPQYRQCTSDLKRSPIQKWIRNNVKDPVIINCMGIRAEESSSRSKMRRMTRDKRMTNSKRTVWTWLPIHDWPETKVRKYLADRNIPLHPVYQYLNRFSCQICIFMSDRDLNLTRKHNPDGFKKIADLEQEIGFTMKHGETIIDAADRDEGKKAQTEIFSPAYQNL